MTDFWGQPLNIGDRVTYIDVHYQELRHGEIINLSDKQATIRTDEYRDHEFFKDRMGYGKTCRSYSCIVKEARP